MPERTPLLAAPATLYLLLAFAAPVALLCAASFWVDGRPSVANYATYLGDPFYLGVIWNSVKLGLITSALTLAIAYPSAFAMARCRPAVQSAILALLFVPLTVGTIIKTFGWTVVLRRNGVVNQAIVALGLAPQPLPLLFNQGSLVAGMANLFLPYMLLPLYASVRMIDARLPEAAATLGATPAFRFVHLTLPLTLPGIVAGFALVFSLSIAAYVAPLLMIGDRYPTMSVAIARGFLYVGNAGLGATMAVALLAIAGGVVLGSTWLAGRLSRS